MKYYIRESKDTKVYGPYTKAEIYALIDGGLIHYHWNLFRVEITIVEVPDSTRDWDYVSTIRQDGYFTTRASIFTVCSAAFIIIISPLLGLFIGLVTIPLFGWGVFWGLLLLSIFLFGFGMIIEYLHNAVRVLHRIELSLKNALPK